MTIYTLDWTVRNYLLKNGYSLHWYLQALLHAVDCLSDLHMNDLHIVNSRTMPVNDYNAFDLPEGYTDYVGVFIKVGQKLRALTEDDTINPLNNFDSDFNIQRYDTPPTQSDDQSVVQIEGLLNTWFYGFSMYDALGEPTGRLSGIGNPTNETFKIVKERNQVQLNENLSVDDVVFQWVSDGRSADAVSSVESYVLPVIRQYIKYGLKDCNRTYGKGEVELEYQKYLTTRKTLRGQKSNLTMGTLKQIVYKNYRMSASK